MTREGRDRIPSPHDTEGGQRDTIKSTRMLGHLMFCHISLMFLLPSTSRISPYLEESFLCLCRFFPPEILLRRPPDPWQRVLLLGFDVLCAGRQGLPMETKKTPQRRKVLQQWNPPWKQHHDLIAEAARLRSPRCTMFLGAHHCEHPGSSRTADSGCGF